MPDNGLAPPNMPWLWQPNSPVGQPNGLGPPMLNYAAPPSDTSQGAGVAAAGQQAWQWLQDQRAESVRQGLLDPDTGLPTQKGVVQGVGQTAQGVMMGTTAPGDVPPPGIVAYHGSPHSFDQFDTSKIGTGEGAQAYGHGLYFAENEGTARQYRDQLGRTVGPQANDLSAAYQDFQNNLQQLWDLKRQGAPVPQELADRIEASQAKYSDLHASAGSMYQVNIGADPEHMLQWDQTVGQHPPALRDKLLDMGYGDTDRGADVYSHMARGPNGDVGASQRLQDAGIPGIRYLDQGSRAARDPIKLVGNQPYDPSDPTHLASHAMDMASGDRTAAAAIADRHAQLRAAEGDTAGADAMRQASTLLQSPRTIPPMTEGQPPGTHNYVVFDANTIDILRKYGIAGLIAGGGAAAAATQQQQPSQ